MPELLLELFSEEIPARMQAKAADDLKRLVTDALVARGLLYEGAQAFATPRRLTLHIVGLPEQGQAVREERKGPRVGAPEAAVQGFLKSAGLASLDQAKIESDPKKGEFYVAVIEKPGQRTVEALAQIIPAVVAAFPWPKSMRWGAASSSSSSLRWVRPLHAIVATFGDQGNDPETVPVTIDGIAAGDTTYGHRFLSPGPIRVRRFDDYVEKLEKAFVVLDAARRRDIIRSDAQTLAFAQGLEPVADEALLEEVAGLVEWPVVLMGAFDPAFLEVPGEVIRATIRANQKCFVLHDPKTGRLAPKFLLTANIEASDGGATIVAGNERVIRARLSDARFFWETDKKVKLEDRLPKLDSVTFHAKLGSQGDRIRRIVALARELAPIVGADPELAARAALLAKADLPTEMVGEFPELQGFMGRTYAALQGEYPAVAAAIEDHYKPLGPSDRVPTDPVSVAVALADKLDTLVGFWAIDEKPTGSKDPFALRRAALGVIRLVIENNVRLSVERVTDVIAIALVFWGIRPNSGAIYNPGFRCLVGPIEEKGTMRGGEWDVRPYSLYTDFDGISKKFNIGGAELGIEDDLAVEDYDALALINKRLDFLETMYAASMFSNLDDPTETNIDWAKRKDTPKTWMSASLILKQELLPFFHDRLKVMLKEQGARHDLVDAVIGDGAASDDLLMIVRRVEALGAFLATEDGANLLAGFRRAANILRAEEKKDGAGAFEASADSALMQDAEEKTLAVALDIAGREAESAIVAEDFAGAMTAMARLRGPVDAFFDKVLVNAPEQAVRINRLRLLAALRRTTQAVADFSRVSG